MNFLDIHPRYRPIASVLVCAVCIAPTAFEMHSKQSEQSRQRQATEQAERAINLSQEQLQREERIALKRAERCILIDEKFPLVEGGSVYYDVKKRDRPLPAGTVLCSRRSGMTAVVDESGAVSSTKQAPTEKISQVLQQRGIK